MKPTRSPSRNPLAGAAALVVLASLACDGNKTVPAPVPAATSNTPLLGHVGVDDARLTVFNDGDIEWTNVVATANNALICSIGIIHPHDQAGMNFSSCSGGPLSGPIATVRVAATQGYFEAATAPAPAVEQAAPTPGPEAQRPASHPTFAPAAPSAPASSPAPSTIVVAEPAAPVAPPAPAASAALALSATISGGIGPARRLTVYNNSAVAWSGCTVTANDLYSFTVGPIAAQQHNGIMMIKFKDKAANIFTSTAQVMKVGVRCDQGSATVVPS